MSFSEENEATWADRAAQFLRGVWSSDGASSVPDGKTTLYGTCYSWLGLYYLGRGSPELASRAECLIRASQCVNSGLFEGPELVDFRPNRDARHSRDHVLRHLTCSAVLPVAQELGIKLRPINDALKYCNLVWQKEWQSSVNWRHAWLEGNNILFVGQLLVYLRDVEKNNFAGLALDSWFEWLDRVVDKKTGLWGTNGYCSESEAVYGGYHQLLVYFYENHPLPNVRGLVDTVLSLQHLDGGFSLSGNAGACEDVDCVDILVNCYKRFDYRRAAIRHALRKCANHILATQNSDGGFPYALDQDQSHMGIPGTVAGPNVSCTFPTWFRIHTLALVAEVLPNDRLFKGLTFQFNRAVSMGWHTSPVGWVAVSDTITSTDRVYQLIDQAKKCRRSMLTAAREIVRRLRTESGKGLRARKRIQD